MKTKYSEHYFNHAAGHIYLDKPGACMINLTAAASMSQDELNYYGAIMAAALEAAAPWKKKKGKRK